jgi:hypothetical protein
LRDHLGTDPVAGNDGDPHHSILVVRIVGAGSCARRWTGDATVNANPLTYRGKSRKQYLAAVATDQLVACALP